jgi:hypothetical protein
MPPYQIFIADEQTHGEENHWDVLVGEKGEDQYWHTTPDAVYNTVPAFLKQLLKHQKKIDTIEFLVNRKFSKLEDWKGVVTWIRRHTGIKVSYNVQDLG